MLTTAHVYDMRPEASDLLNLAALCQRCHNTHDLLSISQAQPCFAQRANGDGAVMPQTDSTPPTATAGQTAATPQE